jgi:hypothetical protein
MESRKILLLGCVALLLATGCAENYRGRRPDLTLTDPAAQDREIQEFRMEQTWSGIEMGKGTYNLSSLMPVIDHVSPAGAEDIDTAGTVRYVSSGVSTLGVAAFLIGSFAIEEQPLRRNTQIAGLATMVVAPTIFSFVISSYINDGIDTYNRDLAARLSPPVTNARPAQ